LEGEVNDFSRKFFINYRIFSKIIGQKIKIFEDGARGGVRIIPRARDTPAYVRVSVTKR